MSIYFLCKVALHMLSCLHEVSPVVEDDEIEVPDENDNKIKVPVSMVSPNPNGIEFDNLYLDMNGIVSLLRNLRVLVMN